MKSPYVSELEPNQIVTATLLVQQKDVRQKKTGEPCLSLILGDRTGEIEARMWDNVAEVMDTFERDDYIRVRGLLQVYQNRLQLTVHKLQRQSEEAVDITDFYPASQRDPELMMGELRAVIADIGNPHLRALLAAVFGDDGIARKFKLAPAAKNVHHAYLGGLIEHVLSMAALARLTASHYKDVDLDLLLTGVLLHDLGKIEELTWDRSFGYSSEGQLLGHISIGLRIVGEKLRDLPEFPPRLRALVEHMILSHHGTMEFGSPKPPQFAEALLLHHIDNLDSKMECMRALVDKDRQVEGCWTGYNAALDRAERKKRKYLDGPDASAPKAREAAAAAQPRPHSQPGAQSQPAQVQRAPSSSPFAEKLQSALRKDV
jgi:3'-5' exoribonuclease